MPPQVHHTLDDLPDIRPDSIRLRPLGLGAQAAPGAFALAGGPMRFTSVELLARTTDGHVAATTATLERLPPWAAWRGHQTTRRIADQLAALTAARAPWAGLPLDRPLVMGVLNVTPDSMSDGGDFVAPEQAIAHGRAMMADGADIIDIGGESTRPGAAPVSVDEEIGRIEAIVRALADEGAVISIDTRHARVMEAALAAGARIINDITALTGDPDSLAVASRAQAPLVLMHMQGEPRTMQREPHYALASLDIADYLDGRVAHCIAAGIPRDAIIVDPGIGFGKTLAHNLEIVARLALLHGSGCGVLLGLSRKGFIGRLSGGAGPKERLPGSLAGALYGLSQGAQILRVHDVAATKHALAVWQAIAAGA
jgi:dihydropteroate synthase